MDQRQVEADTPGRATVTAQEHRGTHARYGKRFIVTCECGHTSIPMMLPDGAQVMQRLHAEDPAAENGDLFLRIASFL